MRSAPVFELEHAPLEHRSLAVEVCVQRTIGCLEVLLKLTHHAPLVDYRPRRRVKLHDRPRTAGPPPAPARIALATRTHVLAIRTTPDLREAATRSSTTAHTVGFRGVGFGVGFGFGVDVDVGGGGGFASLTTAPTSFAIVILGLIRDTVATLIVRLLGHIAATATATTGAEERAEPAVPVVGVGGW